MVIARIQIPPEAIIPLAIGLVALLVGGGLGVLLMTKPFIWPVLIVHEGGTWPRDMMDPEHIMFFGPGLLAIIAAVIAAAKKP